MNIVTLPKLNCSVNFFGKKTVLSLYHQLHCRFMLYILPADPRTEDGTSKHAGRHGWFSIATRMCTHMAKPMHVKLAQLRQASQFYYQVWPCHLCTTTLELMYWQNPNPNTSQAHSVHVCQLDVRCVVLSRHVDNE